MITPPWARQSITAGRVAAQVIALLVIFALATLVMGPASAASKVRNDPAGDSGVAASDLTKVKMAYGAKRILVRGTFAKVNKKTHLNALIDVRKSPNALEPGGYSHAIRVQPGKKAWFGRAPEMRATFTKTACKSVRIHVERGEGGSISVSIPNKCFKTVNKGKKALYYVDAFTRRVPLEGYDELDAGFVTVRKG